MSRTRQCATILVAAAAAIGCSGVRPEPAPYTPTPEEIELDRCRQFKKSGDLEKAEACLLAMCEREPPFARACYKRSRLLYSSNGEEAGRTASVSFIESFPDDALAPTAAKRLSRSYLDEKEWELGISTFQSLAAKVDGTEVYDTVLYNLATLMGEAGRIEDEKKTLVLLVEEHGRWSSQLWDDAMWRLILIYRDQGDKKAEKRALLRLLETKKKSYLIGSYNSGYHDDALLRLGHIAFEEREYNSARDYFRRLAGNKKSRLRDEGLVGEAEVEAALGNKLKACELLQKAAKIPSASSRREAEELSKSFKCVEFL